METEDAKVVAQQTASQDVFVLCVHFEALQCIFPSLPVFGQSRQT